MILATIWMFEKGKNKGNYGEVGDIRVILSRERRRSLMMFHGVLLGFNGFFVGLFNHEVAPQKKTRRFFVGIFPDGDIDLTSKMQEVAQQKTTPVLGGVSLCLYSFNIIAV